MARRRTLLQMRTQVRNYLDETTASFWTDGEIDGYLNEAKDRVQEEVRKLKDDYWDVTRASTDTSTTILGETYDATVSMRLVSGTQDYTLPPDLLEWRAARVTTSGYTSTVLVFRGNITDPDFRGARALTDSVSPATIYCALIGERTLRIAPKIDVTLDWELTYVPIIPDLVANADTLEVPHPLYIAVQEYATSTALQKDRDPNSASWEAKGNASIARFFGANDRQSQDPETVRGYMQEYW